MYCGESSEFEATTVKIGSVLGVRAAAIVIHAFFDRQYVAVYFFGGSVCGTESAVRENVG
jgi:hypothetical protein